MTDSDKLHIFPDATTMAKAAAAHWEEISRNAIAVRGRCDVALAGGSTPRILYRLLATPQWQERIDWRATRIFFGDERCVPADHPDSNFRMAHESLLAHISIPPEQVHRIEAEREPGYAAEAYNELLQQSFDSTADRPPQFDLVLLGLGADGHIASLFPDTPILDEADKWVDACHVEQLHSWRISLTLPVLNAARHLLLLVAGDNKAGIISDVLGGEPARRSRYPVGRLQPGNRLEWLLDRAAASGLTGRGG